MLTFRSACRAGFAVAALFSVAAMAQTAGVELVPDNGVTGILFGTSVGIDGDIAAVGAAFDNGSRGSVTVYTHSGSAWLYRATLVPSESVLGDSVGYFTEVHGNQVFAGAPAHGPASGPNPGAVFVFTSTNGTDWSETQTIEATPAVDHGFFGARFALDGTTLLVSGNDGTNALVYVFADQNGHWVQTGTFSPSEGGDFGTHLSISGNVAVVGAAQGVNATNVQTGVAYVFTRSGGSWHETTRLQGANGAAGDLFGTSVSVSGTTVVVGAPGESVGGSHQGAVHVFALNAGNWTETIRLTAADGVNGNTLGKDVRVCDTRVFAGSSNFSQGSDSAEGVVYRWDRSGTNWSLADEFTLPAPGQSNAYFGDHLGVSSNGLIVGAPFADQAYVYAGGCAVDPIYRDGFE